jgi:hypothetical protein
MKKTYVLLLTVILAGYWINLNGQSTPRQGEIIITEIMVNPEVVSDANGEWFEIWNSTEHDLLLNGVTLTDAGSNLHIMASTEKLVLPAKSYWVLAKNGDPLTNGGVATNYVYQSFTLSNTSDQLILTAADATLIDQISYVAGWPIVSGSSMELHPDYHSFSGNDQPEHWFPAKVAFGAGDRGSPGKSNPVSSGLEEWEQDIRMDIYPNPSQGRFMLEVVFAKPMAGEIRMINLLGQDFIYKTFSETASFKEVIEPASMTPGIWFIEVAAGGKVKIMRFIIEG